MCAAQHLKRYYDLEDPCGEEWELNDEEIAALDLQGAASPMEAEGELPDMNAEEMAKEGFYLVKSVLRHRYRQGWRFLTLWEGFGVEEATWDPFSAFVPPEGRLNSVLVDYFKAQISFIATISKMQDVSEMPRYPKCRDVMDSNRISPHAAAQSPKALNGH